MIRQILFILRRYRLRNLKATLFYELENLVLIDAPCERVIKLHERPLK